MENILSLIFSAENVRMLVLLAFGSSGYVLINSKMGRLDYSLNKRMDGLEYSLNKQMDDLKFNDFARLEKRIDELDYSLNKRIDDLKSNDFAHLNSTIEALTYALEKNGSLKKEDKDYVDSRLAH